MEAALETVVEEIIENLLLFMEDDNLAECKISILFKLKTDNTSGRYNLRNPNSFIEFLQYVKILNRQTINASSEQNHQIDQLLELD